MSGNEWRNLSVAIPAKESRAQAAAWLERRHREDWNAQEQKKLDAWLTASPAHMVAYVRVETAWKRADRLSVLRNLEASQPRLPNLKHARPFLAALAGVLAIVAVVGYLVVPKFLRSDEVVYATGVGGHRAIVLADGTRIELNTQTTLRMKTDHGARVAWLDQGEAYFKIAHDARHPFIVFVDDRRVTDLGTRFVIRRNPADLRVALLEGRALFDAPNGPVGSATILSPGDVVTERNHAVALTRESQKALSDDLGWRRGMLIFKHTTLAAAAEEFNRYNTRKIVIANRATSSLTIGGTFQVNNIDVFARAMKDLLDVQVQNRGNETVISR
jgi:transmembrane sensor